MITVSNISKLDWQKKHASNVVSANSFKYAKAFREKLGDDVSAKLEWSTLAVNEENRAVIVSQWSDGDANLTLKFHASGECEFTVSGKSVAPLVISCFMDQPDFNWLELQTIVDTIKLLAGSSTTARTL